MVWLHVYLYVVQVNVFFYLPGQGGGLITPLTYASWYVNNLHDVRDLLASCSFGRISETGARR